MTRRRPARYASRTWCPSADPDLPDTAAREAALHVSRAVRGPRADLVLAGRQLRQGELPPSAIRAHPGGDEGLRCPPTAPLDDLGAGERPTGAADAAHHVDVHALDPARRGGVGDGAAQR